MEGGEYPAIAAAAAPRQMAATMRTGPIFLAATSIVAVALAVAPESMILAGGP